LKGGVLQIFRLTKEAEPISILDYSHVKFPISLEDAKTQEQKSFILRLMSVQEEVTSHFLKSIISKD